MTMRGDDARIRALAVRIERLLESAPRFFVEVVELAPEGGYRDLLRAWGLVRERGVLERDEEGRYRIPAGAPGGRP